MKYIALVLASLLGACASSGSTNAPSHPQAVPTRWIDLPEAPFVARVQHGKAVLVPRRKQLVVWSVNVGCVVEENGRTHVIGELLGEVRVDAPNTSPVHDLLPALNTPQTVAGSERCPSNSYFALTSANATEGKASIGWKAEGTPFRTP
jgi:hypothetical protein